MDKKKQTTFVCQDGDKSETDILQPRFNKE